MSLPCKSIDDDKPWQQTADCRARGKTKEIGVFKIPSSIQSVCNQETAVEDVWFDHIIPAMFYFAPLCQLGTDWSANSANNAKTRGLGSKGCREALEALTQLCPVCESSLLCATQFRPFGFGFSESAHAEESFEMVWITFGFIFSHKHCELHRLKIPRDASTVPLTVQTSLWSTKRGLNTKERLLSRFVWKTGTPKFHGLSSFFPLNGHLMGIQHHFQTHPSLIFCLCTLCSANSCHFMQTNAVEMNGGCACRIWSWAQRKGWKLRPSGGPGPFAIHFVRVRISPRPRWR